MKPIQTHIADLHKRVGEVMDKQKELSQVIRQEGEGLTPASGTSFLTVQNILVLAYSALMSEIALKKVRGERI